MVAKAHGGGTSFGGVAAYCLKLDRETLDAERKARERPGLVCQPVEPSARVEWSEIRNLATTDVRRAARQMAATTQYAGELKRLAGGSQAGRPLAKPVYHYTLSWAEDERPDRAQMSRAVDESLKALGMEDRQAFVVAHNDTQHRHLHVVVNRVSAENGRAASRGNDRLKLSRWAERWEREQGRIRCGRRVEHNRRREAGELVVDREAAADARFRRGAGKIERSRPQWRPGNRVADVVVQRVHERQAWEAAQRDLAAERAWEDKMQRQEWGQLYHRQKREALEEPGAPETETRHTRERVELGRDHARVARELHEEAAAKYKAAVEAPIRSDHLSPEAIAEELARMEGEMSPADRATFRQQQQQQGPGVTISIDRGRDRGGRGR